MRRNRFAAYLAILALALQAAWPLLAQAQAPSVALVPLCTVDGVTHYLEVPVGKHAPSSSGHSHCALCVLGADAPALVPQNVFAAAPTFSPLLPFHVEVAGPQSLATTIPAPRGPPAYL